MEDFKNNLEVQNKQLQKDLKTTKEHESDVNRKYESLQKKYENESELTKSNNESAKQLGDQRMEQLEATVKETQEQYEMSKQGWDKEKAVLN